MSLIASSTEIVCALGLEEHLVARSHECDWPPSVRRLPQASRPAFHTGGSSRAIDLAVKDRLRMALSVYEVDPAVLRDAEPDVIITQTQCAVCAVTPEDVERSACDLAGREVAVVALEPNRLGDVWEDIRRVAAALGEAERGEELVGRLGRRVLGIGARTSAVGERPGVASVEWLDPLMTAGNWMPELIELAGGRSLFGTAGEHSPHLAWEDVAATDPDVMMISPCGFDIQRTLSEMDRLLELPGWSATRAAASGNVFVADGNAYFHRPGPRLVESLEILAEILHPELFDFGHEGTGWVRAVAR